MSESTCRWNGRNNPRVLRTHLLDCEGGCEGCAPCEANHCGVCARAHVGNDLTCPSCVGAVRDDLTSIVDMSSRVLAEAINRGVNSEAANLAGPVADPEAWSWRKVAAAKGVADHVTTVEDDDSTHPAWVLGTWEMLVREHLEQPSDDLLTISSAGFYLDLRLTRLAQDGDFPVEELARDLRQCRSHLEDVLHEGEQVDTGAPCMKCDVPLRKCWRGRELPWSSLDRPSLAHEDGWACPRCKTWSNDAQYRLAVAADHLDHAEWLTATDMEIRTKGAAKASTVRSWGRDEQPEPRKVRKRRDSERTVYFVADVLAQLNKSELCA